MDDVDVKKQLEKALKARKKADDLKKKVEEKKLAVEKAKEAVKKAEQARKEAEQAVKDAQDIKDVIVALAGYNKESATTRKVIGGYYLYKLLDKFDTDKETKEVVKNGDLHKKINALPAKKICEAVMECSGYYDNSDTVVIYGKNLRAKIDEMLKQKETDVDKAEKLLDDEYKKTLVPDSAKGADSDTKK